MRSRFFGMTNRKLLSCFLVVLFVLFFIGGPTYQSPRHFIAIWNLGHILFFALLSYLLFAHRSWLADRFFVQGLVVLGLCLGIGIMVELFQYGLDRTSDVGDVIRDVIGGLVGIFFLLGSRKALRVKVLTAFQIITIGLVGLQVYPVLTALSDEFLAREQFPVLSSFETPREIARWRGSASFAIDSGVHMDGKCSLRVQLGTDRYSGIHLKYFPENWKGAKGFRFSVYNPLHQELFLTCRINDKKHEAGKQRYSDRFNRLYKLPSGWTTVDIDVQDIRCAPKGRRMDMGHIAGFGIFAINLPQPRVIYIDAVRLVY